MFLKKCIATGMAALLLVSGFASAAALLSSGAEAGLQPMRLTVRSMSA